MSIVSDMPKAGAENHPRDDGRNFPSTKLAASRKVEPMKAHCIALLAFCGLWFGLPAMAQPQVYLRGIVSMPGEQLALLQIGRETFAVQRGDHVERSINGVYLQFNVQTIDLTNETIQTQVNGKEYNCTLTNPMHSTAATSWVHLENADFIKAMEVFGTLAFRVVLMHPDVNRAPFSCGAAWTNQTPTRTEIISCFATLLKARDTVALEDGDCFLQVLPSRVAAIARLAVKGLPVGTIPSRTPVPDFFSESEVMILYGELISQLSAQHLSEQKSFFYFKATRPLSMAQARYGFETLLGWIGQNITWTSVHSFRLTPILPSPK